MTLPSLYPGITEIWPLMNETELDLLAKDIAEHGQQVPVVFVEDMLLDGRNRWLACEKAGVEPWIEDIETDDPEAVAWSLNEHRRHAPEHVRIMASARRETLKLGDNQHTARAVPSQAEVAKRYGVSVDSLQRGKTVLDSGSKPLIDAVDNGDVAVSLAAKTAKYLEDHDEPINSLDDLKELMRSLYRQDHPPPEATTDKSSPSPVPRNKYIGVDVSGAVSSVVRLAEEYGPAAKVSARLDKWSGLLVLDKLPVAIEYLIELQDHLTKKGDVWPE